MRQHWLDCLAVVGWFINKAASHFAWGRGGDDGSWSSHGRRTSRVLFSRSSLGLYPRDSCGIASGRPPTRPDIGCKAHSFLRSNAVQCRLILTAWPLGTHTFVFDETGRRTARLAPLPSHLAGVFTVAPRQHVYLLGARSVQSPSQGPHFGRKKLLVLAFFGNGSVLRGWDASGRVGRTRGVTAHTRQWFLPVDPLLF